MKVRIIILSLAVMASQSLVAKQTIRPVRSTDKQQVGTVQNVVDSARSAL